MDAPLVVLRLLERVHGHLGWLTVAALLHPAALLRPTSRRRVLAPVLAATGLATVTFALGLSAYGDYRLRLRGPIFEASPATGWLFERKEHLAVAVLALAWLGAIAYTGSLVASTVGPSDSHSLSCSPSAAAEPLRRVARQAYALAALLALFVAAAGTSIAAYRSF